MTSSDSRALACFATHVALDDLSEHARTESGNRERLVGTQISVSQGQKHHDIRENGKDRAIYPTYIQLSLSSIHPALLLALTPPASGTTLTQTLSQPLYPARIVAQWVAGPGLQGGAPDPRLEKFTESVAEQALIPGHQGDVILAATGQISEKRPQASCSVKELELWANSPMDRLVLDFITSFLLRSLSAVSSQGHAIMTTFIHRVRELARTFGIIIMVINGTSAAAPFNQSSAFASTIRKPAFAQGPSFTFMTDCTLWSSKTKDIPNREGPFEGYARRTILFASDFHLSSTWRTSGGSRTSWSENHCVLQLQLKLLDSDKCRFCIKMDCRDEGKCYYGVLASIVFASPSSLFQPSLSFIGVKESRDQRAAIPKGLSLCH
ncbi:hypothetical protein C8R48DRAFT_673766 [Suillus tomentosus]|nr:hypothetical protein C8R48DRAFT_673766 [Suillus tomentosus]